MDTPPDAIAREVLEYLLLRLQDADRRQVNLAPPEYHSAAGALFALDRLGLVEDGEAWGERLRDATELFGEVVEDEAAHPRPARPVELPTLPPATLDDALSHLEQLIATERQAARYTGRDYWDGREPPSYWTATAVLRALDAMDLVREEDWHRWSTRFDRAARSEAEPVVTHTAQALRDARVQLERAEPTEPAERPLVHPLPLCTQETLVDVLFVKAPAGATAQPMTVERYADGVVVVWTAPYEPRSRHHAPNFARVTLTDDLGTFYFNSGGGGGAGGGDIKRSRWTQTFAPAIPREARTLRLSIDDEGFALALPA